MEGNADVRRNETAVIGAPADDRNQVYTLVLTGIMAGLVMAATSFFKIPVVATNGYIHLGDAFIFLSVMILGKRNGSIAGASGSALADLLGGYGHWVPWTFVIKGLMALTFGSLIALSDKKELSDTARFAFRIFAMAAGGIVMIAGYFLAQRFIYGTWVAPLAALPGNIIQAASGIAIAEIARAGLSKAGMIK